MKWEAGAVLNRLLESHFWCEKVTDHRGFNLCKADRRLLTKTEKTSVNRKKKKKLNASRHSPKCLNYRELSKSFFQTQNGDDISAVYQAKSYDIWPIRTKAVEEKTQSES